MEPYGFYHTFINAKAMKITILCSDSQHPINEFLENWRSKNCIYHEIEIIRKKNELAGGDILFLISCSEVVNKEDRSRYNSALVLHASDLPSGRGWSPHIWDIISGAEKITLSLIEAEDQVDTGKIWKKIEIPIPKSDLWDEINSKLFNAEIDLIDFAISQSEIIQPQEQPTNITKSYHPRRTPENSRIDPEQSIHSQFDTIRVCDPIRFPAFFELHGTRYKITLEKIDEKTNKNQ